MSEMGIIDFANIIEETSVDTRIIEYRQNISNSSNPQGQTKPLVGVALTDFLEDGIFNGLFLLRYQILIKKSWNIHDTRPNITSKTSKITAFVFGILG